MTITKYHQIAMTVLRITMRIWWIATMQELIRKKYQAVVVFVTIVLTVFFSLNMEKHAQIAAVVAVLVNLVPIAFKMEMKLG